MLQTHAQASSTKIIHQIDQHLTFFTGFNPLVAKDISETIYLRLLPCLQVVLTKVDKLRQGHVQRVVLEVTKMMQDYSLVFPQVFPVRYACMYVCKRPQASD